MEKRNVLDRFVSFFTNLNEKERDDLWSVITALRGPDSGSSLLKQHTTMRIRGALFNEKSLIDGDSSSVEILKGTGALVKTKPSDEGVDLNSVKRLMKEEGGHFLTHLRYAVLILNERKSGCVDDIENLLSVIGTY